MAVAAAVGVSVLVGVVVDVYVAVAVGVWVNVAVGVKVSVEVGVGVGVAAVVGVAVGVAVAVVKSVMAGRLQPAAKIEIETIIGNTKRGNLFIIFIIWYQCSSNRLRRVVLYFIASIDEPSSFWTLDKTGECQIPIWAFYKNSNLDTDWTDSHGFFA